jgi:hypothetical protein
MAGSMFNSMRHFRSAKVMQCRTEQLIFYENLLSEFQSDYENELADADR